MLEGSVFRWKAHLLDGRFSISLEGPPSLEGPVPNVLAGPINPRAVTGNPEGLLEYPELVPGNALLEKLGLVPQSRFP